jgi:hypothetical protein
VTDPDPYQNSPTEIKQFVKKQGAAMSYTVAMDDSGATSQAYMPTDEPVGIPHAFLVGRDGRVVWQGSPLDPSLESVIADVIAGKYDMAAARKAADTQRELDKRFGALEEAFGKGQIDAVWSGLMDILKIDPANEMAMAPHRYLHRGTGLRIEVPRWASRHIQSTARFEGDGTLGATLLTSATRPEFPIALDGQAAYKQARIRQSPSPSILRLCTRSR